LGLPLLVYGLVSLRGVLSRRFAGHEALVPMTLPEILRARVSGRAWKHFMDLWPNQISIKTRDPSPERAA
jgi:hypothetical protein